MITPAVRQAVRQRARHRCEYCRLPQPLSEATLHVEHVVAQQHSPAAVDSLENLALACHQCNFAKGPNLASVDPQTGEIVRLFHPRLDIWSEHFELRNAEIVGLTPCGRATARLLHFNMRRRIELRRIAMQLGEW